MSHSHSHSHGHTHDHGSSGGGGGHGHSHASSPYDRSCQSPTSAAVYGFVCAFVAGALAAVSLPTHVTGYFLPSVPQTALLWCTVGSSAAYAGACVVGFFGVMEESVSAGFGRPRNGLLVLLELFRSLKTAHFLALAADRPVVREYAALPRFSVRGTGEFDGDGLRARLRSVRELGKAPRGWRRERRREEREKRRRWSTSSGSGSDSEADERGLLSA
ncbi:hypothetical protein JCM10450v2_007529 [Rhodotorula kratochvilovae]